MRRRCSTCSTTPSLLAPASFSSAISRRSPEWCCPRKNYAALARTKGILSAVDGAHVPGMMRLNIHELGCDMYSSSPHKWLHRHERLGISLCARRSDRPALEHDRDRRLGRQEDPRRTFPTNRQFECSRALGTARVHQTSERHRRGSDRTASSPAGRLHAGRDDEARGRIMDLT